MRRLPGRRRRGLSSYRTAALTPSCPARRGTSPALTGARSWPRTRPSCLRGCASGVTRLDARRRGRRAVAEAVGVRVQELHVHAADADQREHAARDERRGVRRGHGLGQRDDRRLALDDGLLLRPRGFGDDCDDLRFLQSCRRRSRHATPGSTAASSVRRTIVGCAMRRGRTIDSRRGVGLRVAKSLASSACFPNLNLAFPLNP